MTASFQHTHSSTPLEALGYEFDAARRTWARSGQGAFAYSDGDEVEQRIGAAIENCADVSLFSTELRRHQTDWPSIYHLSPVRANLLRPVSSLFDGARMLEIGAGCGAITRFLGEQGGEVLALEGSPRRASIAASRCRDLANVTVVCDRFDAFAPNDRFDVISLIGVLEYARLYASGQDPVQETLRKALSLLSDDGVLLVAIENQLGLKYFAGVAEDHLGRAMAGIQDQYDSNGVVTFGKAELESRLREAGFASAEFALPFPDYKLPQSIVLPAGYAADSGFAAATLAGQAAHADRQLVHPPLFSMGQAFGVLERNELLPDFSNSFLVLAGKSSASPSFAELAPDVLAMHCATDRPPEYTKITRFVGLNGSITAKREKLCPDAPVPDSSLITQVVADEYYLRGVNWGDRLEAILSHPGWGVDELTEWLLTWRAALAKKLGKSADQLSLDSTVPGELIDAVPRNLAVAGSDARFFDLEWTAKSPVSYGYLAFRAIRVSLEHIPGVARPNNELLLHVPTLVRAVLRRMGLIVTQTEIQAYLDIEASMQDEILGIVRKAPQQSDMDQYVLRVNPDVESLFAGAEGQQRLVEKAVNDAQAELAVKQQHIDLLERNAADQSALLKEKTADQTAFLEQLNHAHAELARFQHIVALQEEELNRVKDSRSWSLTAPLRTATSAGRALRSSVRTYLARTIEQTYRKLPVSQASKQRVKGLFFRMTGGILRNTRAYRRWEVYERTHAAASPAKSARYTAPNVNAAAATGPAQALWPADGVREWAEYLPLRDRIGQGLTSLREQNPPKALAVLDFSSEDASRAAAKIKLPQPPQNPDVTLLIPVYNHLITTLECLASIAANADARGPSFEILIADDSSTDGTAEVLASIPHLRLVSQPRNLGFLRNCNTAAQHARGRNLLLLNNDVQVTRGWLAAMVACLESDPSIGAVGPKIVYPNGRLQEAGARLRRDGTAEMIGLNERPDLPGFAYAREVDYCSGACLLVRAADFAQLGGFDDRYAPAYCEDSDLCMRLRAEGKRIMYCAEAEVVHHLSKTSNDLDSDYKLACISRNLQTFTSKWQDRLDQMDEVRTIAFYLPQFHPIAENDMWWGRGFTEWTNVTKARPNFVGHYQPRVPSDLGYYDLRLADVMRQQMELAKRYGVHSFCYYYYWFAGQRLLERPIEQMLANQDLDMPFCLCWANENWTRRWDGQEHEVLMAQGHSQEDDLAVIRDLMRYFADARYIRVDGKPLLLVYRVALFPDFKETSRLWREACRAEGIGEIYLALVESFELMAAGIKPDYYGCDAAVEFPPHGMAETYPLTAPLLNPEYQGAVADYRDLALRYATRPSPNYKRFPGVVPGWDNTPRRQNHSYVFEDSTPGAFQAWLEATVVRAKQQHCGDERLVFINAWNEWAEGAYLEPDRRFGHAYLEGVRNALDASKLMRHGSYSLGD